MNDRLEERLRQLNVGKTDPALKAKVLGVAEAALAEASGKQGWFARWRVETLLSAGIVAAVVLLLINPFPPDSPFPVHLADQAMVDAVVEELQLDRDLEAHFRTRLNMTERKLAATRRVGHDHRTYDIEEF